jgi:hypothetical protein
MFNFSLRPLLVDRTLFASLGLVEDATTRVSTGAARPENDKVSPKELKPSSKLYASKRNGFF